MAGYRRRVHRGDESRVLPGVPLSSSSQGLRCQPRLHPQSPLEGKPTSVGTQHHPLRERSRLNRICEAGPAAHGQTRQSRDGQLTNPRLQGGRVHTCVSCPVQAPAGLTDGAAAQPGSASRTGPGCFYTEEYLVLIYQRHHEGSESVSLCFLMVPTH